MSNKAVKMLPRQGACGCCNSMRVGGRESASGCGENWGHSATFCVKSALPLLAHCVLREKAHGRRQRGERREEREGGSDSARGRQKYEPSSRIKEVHLISFLCQRRWVCRGRLGARGRGKQNVSALWPFIKRARGRCCCCRLAYRATHKVAADVNEEEGEEKRG